MGNTTKAALRKRRFSESTSKEKNYAYGKSYEEIYGLEGALKKKQKQREKLSGEKNFFYGKSHTIETKQKISESNKGKIRSNEFKENLRRISKGNKKGYSKGNIPWNKGRQVHPLTIVQIKELIKLRFLSYSKQRIINNSSFLISEYVLDTVLAAYKLNGMDILTKIKKGELQYEKFIQEHTELYN